MLAKKILKTLYLELSILTLLLIIQLLQLVICKEILFHGHLPVV